MRTEQQRIQGIASFAKSLKTKGLRIIQQSRQWPDRRVEYFVVGNDHGQTDIVLSDDFLSDLATDSDFQSSGEAYVGAVAGRLRFGSPEMFYCQSGKVIRVETNWPLQTMVSPSGAVGTWLDVAVTELATGDVARIAVRMQERILSDMTPFDEAANTVNRVRRAIDVNKITFHKLGQHPASFQQLQLETRGGSDGETTVATQAEIESFLSGKAYLCGFRLRGFPAGVWAADPWDSEYLSAPLVEMSHAAFVLRAKGLVTVDPGDSGLFAADSLIREGWPAALRVQPKGAENTEVSISTLPKKEELLKDLDAGLGRSGGVALVMIDLDHFKEVNDSKGHIAGDKCLALIVDVLSQAVGRKGTIYRWGGDEFVVMLPDFSGEEALASAERIRREIASSNAGGEIAVTASIGVIAADLLPDSTPESFLQAADKAMYQSKRKGKNRVTPGPISD